MIKFVVKFPSKKNNPIKTQRSIGPTALVVDDSSYFREFIAKSLKGLGLKVKVAQSTMDALELCQQMSFDIITLDYSMPGHTGIELLEILKSKRIIEKSKVIFISGEVYGTLKAKEKYNDVVSVMKPIDEGHLKSTVQMLLSKD